jgi:hypothetical protein
MKGGDGCHVRGGQIGARAVIYACRVWFALGGLAQRSSASVKGGRWGWVYIFGRFGVRKR